ncbi:MAG: outer membrane protein assembly factor BamE [Paracoccaceae bacterium]|nr:MAG: outer membrane protein assembly factor BamE [Paracoccaceae bacterium]
MAGQSGGMRMRRARLGVAVAILAVAAACAQIVRTHGYAPTDAELSEIVVGVDTRDSVAETVGRPSAQGLLNDDGWFYVQSRFRHMGPREPKEIERQVVAITYDQAGVVQNIERFGLEQGRVVALSRRVTESNVRSFSFVRQLLQNFGRFNAGELLR